LPGVLAYQEGDLIGYLDWHADAVDAIAAHSSDYF
jgi:hypothetical protein